MNGLILKPRDVRDTKFSHTATFGVFDLTQLSKDGLDRKPYKINDQTPFTMFCTGAGVSTGSEYQERKPLSFEFQVAAIGRMAGAPIMRGTDLRTALRSRIAYGCLADELTPPELRLKPDGSNAAFIADWRNWPESVWAEAAKHRAAAFFTADGPYDYFDRIRVALALGNSEGQVIIAGSAWQSGWRPDSRGIIPNIFDYSVGGHCYDFVNWKYINDVPYVVGQQSYGSDYGDKGLMYFDRNTINHAFKQSGAELFIFRDVDENSVATLKAQKLSLLYVLLDWYYQAIHRLKYGPATPTSPVIQPVEPPKPPVAPEPSRPLNNKPEAVYMAAYRSIGKDLSKIAPNEKGCAEAASRVLRIIYPTFPILPSTITLTAELAKRFKELKYPTKGCVTIFATKGSQIGHVGFWGVTHVISNDSRLGTMEANYTHTDWYAAAKKRGLRVRHFLPSL